MDLPSSALSLTPTHPLSVSNKAATGATEDQAPVDDFIGKESRLASSNQSEAASEGSATHCCVLSAAWDKAACVQLKIEELKRALSKGYPGEEAWPKQEYRQLHDIKRFLIEAWGWVQDYPDAPRWRSYISRVKKIRVWLDELWGADGAEGCDDAKKHWPDIRRDLEDIHSLLKEAWALRVKQRKASGGDML